MALIEIPAHQRTSRKGMAEKRPLDLADVATLARRKTRRAISVLTEIFEDKTQPGNTRVAAAIAVLDRGWGCVIQRAPEREGENGVEIVIRHLVEEHAREPKTIEHDDAD